MLEVKPNRYEYTPETQHLLACEIVSSWEHETLVEYAYAKLLQEYDTEEAFQNDADYYVEELEINIPEKAPKMTPQMDLSNVDPEVVKRTRARVEVEALTRLRRRYDMLNSLASSVLETTGYLNNPDYTEISVEQALRAAELAAKATQLAEEQRSDND